jgi:hypothetical protein
MPTTRSNRTSHIITDLADQTNPSLGASLIPTSARVVDFITAVNCVGLPENTCIIARHRSIVNDGGGGIFIYSSASIATIDNGIIFAPSAGTGRLIRQGYTVFGFNGKINVAWFGALGSTPATADTPVDKALMLTNAVNDKPAFDAAIAARAINGGIVELPNKLYAIGVGGNSTLTVPPWVVLQGMSTGPFDNTACPCVTVIAPTFLCVNTSTNFLTLGGMGSKVLDCLFYYPNQVAPNSATAETIVPVTYPYTILITLGFAGQRVERCTIVNAYDGIDCQTGRAGIIDCYLGAMHNDIRIDRSQDWVDISGTKCQVMWNVFAGLFGPQNIDTWVRNNGIALLTRRVDSLQASSFGVFGRYIGHLAEDSPDLTIGSRAGYGALNNVDYDTVAYGVYCTSSNQTARGFLYNNVFVGANASGVGTPGQASFFTALGGTETPEINVVGGAVRGTWAIGSPSVLAAVGTRIYTENVLGVDNFGPITAPTFPASNVAFKNPWPFPVQILVAGGVISGVLIGGNGAGAPYPGGACFTVLPYQTITFIYTGSPGWSWFGL